MPLPRLGDTSPLVSPLYTSAVYALPDLDALDAVYEGREPGYVYARDAHPNAHQLAADLAALEGGTWGLVCGSGMAALSAAFLGLLSAGDRIVASDRLYGRTTRLLRQELHRFGVAATFIDICDLPATCAALEAHKPQALFLETMSNPLCRVPDLPALADLAHVHGTRLIVDNTFATPVLCKPLAMGADIVMESLTKMIGGHSDVTLGFLAGNEPDLLPHLNQIVSTWGLSANPFDCWQAERGSHTLDVRMRAATANAAALADWLAGQAGVSKVVYPGRSDHPDHALASRLFPRGYGNMLCFELVGGREAVNRFMRAAPGIPFSPSLGHTLTTISHPASTSHRYDSAAEKQRQGITDGLVRVSLGCEAWDVIAQEMSQGLTGSQNRSPLQ
jgi:cystathionine beta-lyase/cystathionine gamma-synthase